MYSAQNSVLPEFYCSSGLVPVIRNCLTCTLKVFEICGQPSVGRRRRRQAEVVGRSARRTGSLARWPVVRGQTDNDDSSNIPLHSAGVADIVHRIRLVVNTTLGFWSRLSHNECSNFTLQSSDTCWNGTHFGRYVRTFLHSC